ncbi:hypothetical protein SAMN04488528_101057 [Clostridium frigidicarnis]|uniref:Uncharacterized protein n=1 Tax=Clostridium frigidicarnis TaxID=84698 RepID=A0A1I0XZM9_9CLOT|nr:hypothetical protein SAMN04488528_101057 [Clostridium frigidicarnis]
MKKKSKIALTIAAVAALVSVLVNDSKDKKNTINE